MEDPLDGGNWRQVLRVKEGIHVPRLERKVLLAGVLGRDFVFDKLVSLDEPRKSASLGTDLRHHGLRVNLLPVIVYLREAGGDLVDVGLGIAGDYGAKGQDRS